MNLTIRPLVRAIPRRSWGKKSTLWGDKDSALFAECKWTNEKIDIGLLEKLAERSKLFNYKKTHFYLFAKTGFTKGCIDRAEEMGNVTLITYGDILK
ncbi:MAG: hypothetical protein ACLSFO_03935 [Anaerovoracaceae bacterium]